MKTCTGEYLNLFTEIGHDDNTDLPDDKLDIFILFCESCLYSDDFDMTVMETRARNAIENFKNTQYVRRKSADDRSMRFIPEKVKAVLENEFEDASVLVVVNELR